MEMTQKELNDNILSQLALINQKLLSAGDLSTMIESLKEMKKDISELKFTLLNPENGVIVKNNKNTEVTKEHEDRITELEDDILKINELVKFKDTVTKVLWVLFTTVVGILATMYASP
jgi:predicted RNA-binding protein with EMAP domain